MVNIEKRFIQVKEFLERHENLLQTEVLENNINSLNTYIPWSKELLNLSIENQINCEFELETSYLKNTEFINFISSIKDLIKIPKAQLSQLEIPAYLTRKLSKKKTHELKQIKYLVDNLNFNQIIDIGGGAGHLASYLICDNEKKAISFDLEEKYQIIGKEKLKRYAPEILKRLDFKTQKIDENTKLPQIQKSLTIGLHACGDLSSILLKNSIDKEREILSLGCCYHKCTKQYLNLSQIAQNKPLHLSFHSLTMAAKTFKTLDREQFERRQRVKDFRYAIHLFATRELGLDFQTLGNAKPHDYQGRFSKYAHKYLPVTQKYSEDILNNKFKEYQEEVRLIQTLGSIRSMLSRLVELYIILDRALFLQERGKRVEVLELFETTISPRNLAIISSGLKK